jgi:F-type H+-transporting ATPase subunit epsilon
MAKTFQVGIYSADKIIYEGPAVSLVAPSALGSLGILADHAPLVAKLLSGKITIRTLEGSRNVIDSPSGGFLQILHNQAVLLL